MVSCPWGNRACHGISSCYHGVNPRLATNSGRLIFSEGTIIELKWILYSNDSFFLCNLVMVSQSSTSGFFGCFKTWHGSKQSSTLLHQKAGVHGLMGVSPFGWNSNEHRFVTAPQFEESHRLMVKWRYLIRGVDTRWGWVELIGMVDRFYNSPRLGLRDNMQKTPCFWR
jgi:hypothetical protein